MENRTLEPVENHHGQRPQQHQGNQGQHHKHDRPLQQHPGQQQQQKQPQQSQPQHDPTYVSHGEVMVHRRTLDAVCKTLRAISAIVLVVGGVLSCGALLNGMLFVLAFLLDGGIGNIATGVLLLVGAWAIGSMTNCLYRRLCGLVSRRAGKK
jgi:ABC-type nickel/cobalt efflux system permease component RcnA